jgi:hypothetical protein
LVPSSDFERVIDEGTVTVLAQVWQAAYKVCSFTPHALGSIHMKDLEKNFIDLKEGPKFSRIYPSKKMNVLKTFVRFTTEVLVETLFCLKPSPVWRIVCHNLRVMN